MVDAMAAKHLQWPLKRSPGTESLDDLVSGTEAGGASHG